MTVNEKRALKYPDTVTFSYYNANPKNKLSGDCVVRAICTALNQSWEQTLRELTEVGVKYGYVFNDKQCYGRYLESKGWCKVAQPRKSDNTKYTGEEWCKLLCKNGKTNGGEQAMIAHIGGRHIVCIKNYKILDIWDSSQGCIGNCWIKRSEHNE